MTRQWLRALARYYASPQPARRQRRSLGQSVRPHLEDLESRQLPSTVTVTTPADNGPGSLRQALLDTQDGDTINFDAALAGQTIVLSSGELAITKSVDIEGPGADQLTISGNQAGRVFNISQDGLTVTIAGLTIANGVATGQVPQGGGIFIAGGHVTLSNCTLSNNEASGGGTHTPQGGGIYIAGGTVALSNCTLSNNEASPAGTVYVAVPGGGIYIADGDVTLSDCTLSGNDASGGGAPDGGRPGVGGGIYVAGGSLVVNQSTFSANQVTGGTGFTIPGLPGGPGLGGGIYLASGSAQVNDSTLSFNYATGGRGLSESTGVGGQGAGGGIYVAGGSLALHDSTLSFNFATGGQGGPANRGQFGGPGGPGAGGGLDGAGGTVVVLDSTFAANEAVGGMGGMGQGVGHDGATGQGSAGGIANAGALTLTGVTLSGNVVGNATAPNGSGGGLVTQAGATTTIRNAIVAANFALSSPDVDGALNSLGHNLIGDGTGGSGFSDTDLVGTADAPIAPQLQPLGDYGGPTQTLRPLPSSPAVDAGDNTDAPPTDQRGFRRIVHRTIDIGAVELQRGERHGRHHLPSQQSESSAEAAEVARIIPALVAGRPQVLLEDSTLLPTLPAPRLGPDRGPGSAHPLDAFFQLSESNEQQGKNDRPTVVARAGERGSLLWFIPGIDRGEDFASLLV